MTTLRKSQPSRLPDIIFGRDRHAEREGGFLLAGRIVTDLPKSPSEEDLLIVEGVIKQLVGQVRRDPNLHQVGIWRSGQKPPDGLAPPFPEERMLKRMRRCLVIDIRIDGVGRITLH